MKKVYILAYGTLKRNCQRDATKLFDAKFIGDVVVKDKILKCLSFGFPVMVDKKDSYVKAEVFEIYETDLKYLDEIEGVKHGLYKRATLNINVNGESKEVIYYEWMFLKHIFSYCDTNEWNEEIIAGGNNYV